MICRNKKIKGVLIGNHMNLLTQFANDLGLFLINEKENWDETMHTLGRFEDISGLKINYDKTMVYHIGLLKNSDARFYSTKNLNWTNEPIKVLGIWIAHSREKRIGLNLDPLIERTESPLKLWTNRDLSLGGKIFVINSLLASMYVYKFNVLSNIPVHYWNKL